MSQLSSEEFLELTRELEKHHAVFYKLWQIGKPLFVTNTKTAYVQFDKNGECILFGINKNFWDSCSLKKKAFVICHECLHIIFNHGLRIVNSDNSNLGNIAADIVINNELIRKFGFNRQEVDDKNELCWIDTCFKKELCDKVSDNESLEYYYNLLRENGNDNNLITLDDHGNFGSNINSKKESDNEDGIKNIVDSLEEALTDEEKESLKKSLDNVEKSQAGNVAGNIWKLMSTKYVAPKRKWETVIKKWCTKQIKDSIKDVEQWTRTNRRFTFLDKELILPTEMEIDELENEKDKIQVYFFLDTSGSCMDLADRFWKAAKSLPENKFDIKLYCFDISVYEVDIKNGELYGFGGTSFNILESYVQKAEKYPKAIFVITDGYGDTINPKYPQRWHWFLSTSYMSCINSNCNIYQLSNFE